MRNCEINADEFAFANEPDRFTQLVRQNVKPRILPVNLAMLEGSILHLRRKRMLDWIAQDAETNRRIDFAQGLQIGERVNLFACRAFLFHVEG